MCKHYKHHYITIDSIIYRTCLDQLLIMIRSFIILCDHTRSKTRLIVIMNLIATLAIIYTGLQNHTLSLHRACYYIQTGHRERGKVESSESVAAAHSGSV